MLNSDGTAKQYKILDDSLQTDFLQRESDLNLEETRDTTVSENDPTDSKRDADVNLEDKDIETTRIIKNAGDISIFKFYASALGAVPLFLFLVSMFISSVIDKVPCKLLSTSNLVCNVAKQLNSDIPQSLEVRTSRREALRYWFCFAPFY